MNSMIAPIRFFHPWVFGFCSILFLLPSAGSNAADEPDRLIYREIFSNDTGEPLSLEKSQWQVHRSGSGPAKSVQVAADEGQPTDLDPVRDGKPNALTEKAKKFGYLHHAGDAEGRAYLYWTQAKLNRDSESILRFSWHQRFAKGRDGNRSVADSPLVRQTIARLAVRIGEKWYVSRRVSSVYQEKSDAWEMKSFAINGEQQWSEIDFDGKRYQFGFRDVPALPAGPITAFGINCDEATGEKRLDSFQVHQVKLKIPEVAVEPDVAGAWPQYKRNSRRAGDAAEEELSLPLKPVGGVRFPAPIYASPAVIGGKVYLQDADGHVACIDDKTSQVEWTTTIGGINNSSSPAVSGGRVYVGSTAGFLAILDADSGKVLQKVPAPEGIITAPAVTPAGIYFSTLGGKLVKVSEAGEIVWTFDGGPASITEFAVRGDEILFCGGSDRGGSIFFRLRDAGEEPVTLSTRRFTMCPTGGPAFGRGASYAIQSFDSEGGRFEIGSPYLATSARFKSHTDLTDARITPSVRGDRFYRGDACFAENGAIVWRVDREAIPRGGFHSSPALSKNHMVIGTEDGRVQFIPLDSGANASNVRKPAWTFRTQNAGQPNSAVSSSIAIADGRVFFGCEDGVLYILGQGEEKPIAQLKTDPAPPEDLAERVNDHEWHTVGGDMGYSLVAPASNIRPPFRLKWRTRVWSSFKGPMIVAEGKVFAAGRLGQLTVLDADSGRILWRTHHGDLESRPGATYAKGKVLVLRGSRDQHGRPNAGGGLWCHDASTGKLAWRAEIPFAYHFNADGVAVAGEKVLVAYNGGEEALEAVALDLATGRELWKKRYDEVIDTKSANPVRTCGVVGKEGWFVSVPGSPNRRGTDNPTGATLAINPDSGELLWKNDKFSIHNRSRISYRKGILVVFGQSNGQALRAATGEHLWTGAGHGRGTLYMNTYYQQPLTDDYLDSKGQEGIVLSHACSYSVAINRLFYGHERPSSPTLVARAMDSTPPEDADLPPIIWQHHFLSRACPAPTPAYGRLYYGANGEGVVYCFEPVEN